MAGWRGERGPERGDLGRRPVTTSEPATEPTTNVPRPKRARQSVSDMVRSLVLVAVAIGVTLIFVPGLLHPSKSQHFPAADYQDYVIGFRQLTGVPALVPTAPPRGWRANAAALTTPKPGAHLHIGWVVPGSKYVGLEESIRSPTALTSAVLGARGSTVVGHVLVNGQPWQVRTSDRGEYALSRTMDGVNVVITGSATGAEIQDLAATLQPAIRSSVVQPSASSS
jgi:Protein of unknown function (DUF4245)